MGARVVVDTNVLVSALGWRGTPHRLVRACTQRRHVLLLSSDLLAELERVLRYPKLGFAEHEITEYLELLAEVGEMVEPRFRLRIVQADPTDNKFLECAVEGRADAIVSGDADLASLGTFEAILILSPQAFLDRFGD